MKDVLDPGACPGHDPEFAGVTTKETYYDSILVDAAIRMQQN